MVLSYDNYKEALDAIQITHLQSLNQYTCTNEEPEKPQRDSQ